MEPPMTGYVDSVSLIVMLMIQSHANLNSRVVKCIITAEPGSSLMRDCRMVMHMSLEPEDPEPFLRRHRPVVLQEVAHRERG